MTTLKEMIMRVESNSDLSGLCWSDWNDALVIIAAYAPNGIEYENESLTEMFVTSILNRGIKSNGRTLPGDCGLYEHLIWGPMVSFTGGGFWIESLDEKYGARDKDTFSDDY